MPSGSADRAFMQVVYGAHPYAHMALGTEDALRRMTVDDVRAFHRRTFAPVSVTLIASGEIAPGEFQLMAAEVFGDWDGPGTPASLADPALTPPPLEPAHRL